MSKWMDYGRDAVEFAAPYVKQAGAYAEDAAGRIGKGYRKHMRRLRWDMRISRLNRALGVVRNVFLILASAAALIALLQRFLEDD